MTHPPRPGPTARAHAESESPSNEPFALDLERIQFSPYFSRLSAVTQVVSPSVSGAPVHNRLTHSLRVGAIARAVAAAVNRHAAGAGRPERCDSTVVEAAAYAHDLGHPPFGHLGESVLDRLAREELGIADGFEGNAQTYRILTTLDVTDAAPAGLNLTAAVRAAVAKYPWSPSLSDAEVGDAGVPRGIRRDADSVLRVNKYSAYDIDVDDLRQARALAGIPPLRQSLEGAVMDIADDIAYSIHDVDDFYRSGILDHALIAAEFEGWLERAAWWAALSHGEIEASPSPGAALERLRRKMRRDDGWIADDDVFHETVARLDRELVGELLAQPFDGSLTAERRLAAFSDRWIRTLQESVHLSDGDAPRSGPVTLTPPAWHAVEVLKFVHKRFVLSRPDLAIHQRGLSRILVRSVRALQAWLDDPFDRERAPARLHALIDLARNDHRELRTRSGSDEPDTTIERLAQGRGVLDYVASLTDAQAVAFSEAMWGRGDRLWSLGQRL